MTGRWKWGGGLLWDMGAGYKERLRTAGRSHQLQKQIKGLFTQKILFFSFFLLNLQIQRFIRASLLAFVHFVSGFNARGLNCCCGNHCLCFLLPPIVPWHNRLLSNNMRGSSLAFSEKWTAAGSGHLVCLRKQWHNIVFCLGKSALNSLSSFLKMRTRRSYLEELDKGETGENQRTHWSRRIH